MKLMSQHTIYQNQKCFRIMDTTLPIIKQLKLKIPSILFKIQED